MSSEFSEIDADLCGEIPAAPVLQGECGRRQSGERRNWRTLQFSILGGRPNYTGWPDYFDEAKLFQFLAGYHEVAELEPHEPRSLLDLMPETMIAEAMLPAVATGFFAHLNGFDFLAMIQRKAD
jgi:hypothetical protein